jgi:hypothetical protein
MSGLIAQVRRNTERDKRIDHEIKEDEKMRD